MLVEAEYVSEELMWETVVNVKAFVAPVGSCCAIAIISSFTTGTLIIIAFDLEGNTIRSRRHQYWYLPTYNPVYPSSQIKQEQYKHDNAGSDAEDSLEPNRCSLCQVCCLR